MAGRNSDGSYDAVDSGGFGKDYHGQDVFGERIGGTGIGGNHFGGFAAGHVGLDEDNTDHFAEKSYGDIAQTESMPKSAFEADSSNESEEEAGSDMKDALRDLNSDSSEENSNTGSMDTSLRIGDSVDEKREKEDEDIEKAKAEEEKAKAEKAKAEEEKKSMDEYLGRKVERLKELKKQLTSKETKKGSFFNMVLDTFKKETGINWGIDNTKSDDPTREVYNILSELSSFSKVKIDPKSISGRAYEFYDENSELWNSIDKALNEQVNSLNDQANDALTKATEAYEAKVAERIKKEELKASFTDKMKEDKEKAKPGPNMSKASVGESDYLTKANKDSTKEVPKEKPSRNDFPNHAVDTLKGAVDIIADNTTAKALGIQSLEDFAKENGVDPNKLSTMKAYQRYQNKQIVKALPNIMKKVGGFFFERIKDFFDPKQAPERIRNTLARYNAATLVGAAILSMKSGAGIQTSIDQALTMVDPEDQPAVSDFLEDVLNDEGTVADLSNAFDDALAPEQTNNTEELDESIVNIGRKDNTDYSDFNAGLGTSGTTSDADVKVFIARNIKEDPILRRMISKLGK